jgi:Transposase DDE domain group 1
MWGHCSSQRWLIGRGARMGFSEALCSARQRKSAHDPGAVLRHLAVTIADGGDCVTDLAVLRGQESLFGPVASDVTAWRTVAKRAPKRLCQLRETRARARDRVWRSGGAPSGKLTVDFDSTVVESHSEKEWASGTYKRTFGFNPLVAYVDVAGQSSPEALAGILRPGSASPDNAKHHLSLLRQVLRQLPEPWRQKECPKLARSDSAGASHDFVNALRKAGFQFSIGFRIQPWVREAHRGSAGVRLGAGAGSGRKGARGSSGVRVALPRPLGLGRRAHGLSVAGSGPTQAHSCDYGSATESGTRCSSRTRQTPMWLRWRLDTGGGPTSRMGSAARRAQD